MSNLLLERIDSPSALKMLNMRELEQLCCEIRSFLVKSVSETGGHLASNLGVVELTVMLHFLFDSPNDKIIWDVGHQCYVHKILTGRREYFHTLRQKDGISGFCNPNESPHDIYGAGHSSTSISAALGIAMGEKLNQTKNFTIAVIGDGSMTGGLAYEALNNAGHSGTRLIIVINDNDHSISNNVGAIADTLGKLRISSVYYKTKLFTKKAVTAIPHIGCPTYKCFHFLKNTLKKFFFRRSSFLQMGLEYIGPIDGHDLHELRDAFTAIKAMETPCILHVKTKKGKGYYYAEENPDGFHGISGFNIATGVVKSQSKVSFSDFFGMLLCEKASCNHKICAITAAMKTGTGLSKFALSFPNRFFDVGIAEQHAVVFAAGLATTGMIPVVAIYSTFLQRAYDQILHDVGLQDLKVIFAIDRAGMVGADGATHQGIFDVSYLNHIPNMEIYAPASYSELNSVFNSALASSHPSAIRYPKGGETHLDLQPVHPFYLMKKNDSAHLLLISYGRLTRECLLAAQELRKRGVFIDILQLLKIKPLDSLALQKLISGYSYLCFAEEAVQEGSIGQEFFDCVKFDGYFRHLAVTNGIVLSATEQEQLSRCGLDALHIVKTVLEDNYFE